MMEKTRILLAGDSAVSVQFGDAIDPEIYARVRALYESLKGEKIPGVTELIPTFRSLMVQYDPRQLGYEQLKGQLEARLEKLGRAQQPPKKVITIPVCFGGSWGEDLEEVARYHDTTPERIVELFCSSEFLIYMLGFTPGYPYIGGVPRELVTPRLDSPRLKVPAGTVGIGGEQLGIYPIESPGGFRLVGNTTVRLYDPENRQTPVMLEAGEYIRFTSIGPKEYEQIRRQVEEGSYRCQIREG